MPQKSAMKSDPVPRYGSTAETALRFGLGIEKLRKMRVLGIGPAYSVAGYRTVLYEFGEVEKWIASLPKGGGGTR
jgi:hypothetical protein